MADQADDNLRQMADRIQARAVRHCGELLKQFDGAAAIKAKVGAHLLPLHREERQQNKQDCPRINK